MSSDTGLPATSPADGTAPGPTLDTADMARPDGAPAPTGGTVSGDGAATEQATTPDPEATPRRRGRRRRILLLLLPLLLLAATALLAFGGWYLVNRKPVSELPVPGIAVEAVPHYSFSIYDVVAPTGVAVSADGSRIYATQTEGDPQVIAFDGSGRQVASLKPPATSSGDHVPVYVAVNPVNGDVYVSDRPAGTIYVYSAAGSYLRAFDPGPSLRGWAPLGLAFDAKGNLFVTSVGAPFQAVHEFGPDGTLIRTYGKANDFNFPNGVAADAAGNVYVADSNNGRMVVFDPLGNRLGAIGRGAGTGDLGLPRGMAIDDSGRIYVADVSQQGVQVYHLLTAGESAPRHVGRFGEEGSGDGGFRLPNAVAVDGRSRVYVADWRNNRIQVWTY
jgi:DNA-binding beta-propeller fold protein YncE